MGEVVYVIFFAFAGADLDLTLLRLLWPLALILVSARAGVTFGAARLASALAKDPPSLRRWSWSPLLAQAGFTIGLGSIMAREFPAFGTGFRALVLATVGINEVIGPILFKLAVDRSGEAKGPAPSLTEAAEEAS
jgi:Kef-type K+ transport system membrane component KefB